MSRKNKRYLHTWDYGWWSSPPPSRGELLRRVDPLIRQIQRVDEIVARVAGGQGRIADLVGLEQVLKEPFVLTGSNGRAVMLAQPAEVRDVLGLLGRELHFEVHAVDGQYPCYLLGRVSNDSEAPDLVLEEFHVSPLNDFFPDERFTILLRNGRSRTFLRLAPFREKLKQHLSNAWGEPPDDPECDEVLTAVATLVLAAAWYEDQRLPFIVADTFGLRQFRFALELAAFLLGSDLYRVASGVEDCGQDLVGFFRHVYENPPLAEFLDRLNRYGAVNVGALEEKAREAFMELNRAFSTFLSTPGAIRDLEPVELYKVVLGCFGKLSEVASKEHWTSDLEHSVLVIEQVAADFLDRLSEPT